MLIHSFKKIIITAVLGICSATAVAQSRIAFQHLNTSNGLSYLGVNSMCVDKKGNLWVATGNGLNMFNGKTVEKYFAAEYPQLQNNNVITVSCDSSNRIWVLTAGGNVTMLDEKRQLHRVALYEKNNFIKIRWVVCSRGGGIILFTASGNFAFNKQSSWLQNDSLTQKQFSYLPVNGFDSLQNKGFGQILYYDENSYFFVQEDNFFKVNYTLKTVEKKFSIPHCTVLTKWNTDELLLYDRLTNEVKILDLATEAISYPFKDIKDQFGKNVTATFIYAKRINATQYLLTTLNSGIYIYDTHTGKIYNHTHNISDPSSIGNDATTIVTVGKKGWVFVTCNPNGVSYFNCNEIVSNQNVFADTKGHGYDGYIAGIATKDNNTYYIGTAEGLLQWNRNTNNTVFINYPGKNGEPLLKKQEVASVLVDDKDRIWVTAATDGIIVIDKNLKRVRHIKNDGPKKYSIKLKSVTYLKAGPDGNIWASGGNGICKINATTFEVDNFENTPLQNWIRYTVFHLFLPVKMIFG